MGLTKEQWMDVIEDIKYKVYSGIPTEIPVKGKLPDVLFSEMKQCIGLDYKESFVGAVMYFHTPHRNFYEAEPVDEPMWEALVEKGFAWKRENEYHLTVGGLHLLGQQTGAYIYNPNEGDQLLREVRAYFIFRRVYYSYGCLCLVTKGDVKRDCLLTRKKMDWAINKLLEEGWIVSYKDAWETKERHPYCRTGFIASKKLEETEEFKKAWKERCEALGAIVRGEN